MSTDQRVRIELTPEQRSQVKEACGKAIATIELKVDELEQRVAPSGAAGGVHFSSVIITC
jgi:hypothetical protein